MRTNKLFTSVAIAASIVLAQAAPALAYSNDAGEEAGQGMSILETLSWFVFAPAAIWAVSWFLWSLPQWRRTSAPTTGDKWDPKPSNSLTK
ncbi:MAG: hypothetical protein RL410_1424 [Actinomycetota bacterium]|jgi:hypothetical protein